MTPSIIVSDSAGVRTITLNRPERLNAIDLPMIEQLEFAVGHAQDDDAIRVILLRGAGRAFSAGDDVEAQAAICREGEGALRSQLCRLQRISELLVLGKKLSVAASRGWAVGAGFSWVLNCDFRLWSEKAGAFLPEVEFGSFVTGGATLLLPHLLGRRQAHQMLFLGDRLRSAEAEAIGLLHAVCPEDSLDEDAYALACKLADLPSVAATHMRRALAAPLAHEFRKALDREIESCVATTLDSETLARMLAAITKR